MFTPFHQRLRVYAPAASWLFHNGGDGTLTDLSAEWGLTSANTRRTEDDKND